MQWLNSSSEIVTSTVVRNSLTGDDKESRVHLQLVRLKIIDFDFFTKQYTWKHSKYPVARHCFLAESQVLVYQAPRETHCTEKDLKTLNAPLHINHILNGA